MVKKLISLAVVCLLVMAIGQSTLLADAGPEHQVEQARPIQLGTTGSNINDSSSGWCCTGTLGALVEDAAGVKYILSNNHVLALSNHGASGELIIHPGLGDQACPPDFDSVCTPDTADNVAYLSDFVPIGFIEGTLVPLNEVDAAIAEIVAGAVEPDGAILDIGTLSSETVLAGVGQAVKKSGRTTGFTTGTVTAVDVTVDVGYSEECGGPVTNVARFTNQILIGTRRFSAGGDSGSIIVEDVASEPRAVGLLFAGNNKVTVANPIDVVLGALGVTMVGGAVEPPSEPGQTGTIAGKVTSAADGKVIKGAMVFVLDTDLSGKTDRYGNYTITDVPVGDCSVQAMARNFNPDLEYTTVVQDQVTDLDFALNPILKTRGGPPSWAAVNNARDVKGRHEAKLFGIKGVVGTGVGRGKADKAVIEVYLKEDSAEARANIPQTLDGVPVNVIVTGPIEAF